MTDRHFVFGSTDRRTLAASATADASNRDRVFADESHAREPASARGVLADDDAEAAAAAAAATSGYADTVTPSSYVPFQTSFLGETRHVLRHVAHEEDEDEDEGRTAGRRDEPATHVRRSDAHEYFDVYEQLGHAPMYQDPETLADFARDLKDERFLNAASANIRESRAPPRAPSSSTATPAARLASADKLRADIARAMASCQGAADVLSLDYLRLVPAEFVDAFAALREVQAIVGTLVPLLYVPAALREHWTQRALNDVLGGAGCTFFASRAIELAAGDPSAPFAGYTGSAGAYERDDRHTHAAGDRLPLSVMTYLCTGIPVTRDASKEAAAAAAAATSQTSTRAVPDTLAERARPLGSAGNESLHLVNDATDRTLMYLLDVVVHRVDTSSSSPRFCFRTFAFRSELLLTSEIRAVML